MLDFVEESEMEDFSHEMASSMLNEKLSLLDRVND